MSYYKKTPSEVDLSIQSTEVSASIVKLNILARNPFFYPASLDSISYQVSGSSTWTTGSVSPASSANTASITLNGKFKKVTIEFDAVSDLGVFVPYNDLSIRARFYDRANQAGALSSYASASLNVDFRPSTSSIEFLRPYANEPYAVFEWKTPRSYANVRYHYLIEFDTVNTFNSANYNSVHSKNNQSEFRMLERSTYNSSSYEAFNSNGIAASTSSLIHSYVQYLSTQSFEDGRWYYRVSQSLHSF